MEVQFARNTISFLIGVLICLSGCSLADRMEAHPSQENTAMVPLRVQLPTEPMTLDPTLAMDGASLQILVNVHDGLLGYSSDGTLEHRLASGYEISKDGKKYVFTLRPGILWSDGQPIIAKDFVTALRRTLNPKTVSRMAASFFGIRNAKPYFEGKLAATELGVSEQNGKLLIVLEKPIPSFVHSLTLTQAFPLRQDILDQNGGLWPESGPVTGPYRISSHQFEQTLKLERNLKYFNPDATIAQVEYKITDEATGINLFDQKRLDILTRISNLDLPRLKQAGRVYLGPFLATYYLSFNCRVAPFNDRELRRAVAGSVKRNELVQILGGGEYPAWSWIPRGLEGFIPYRDPSIVFADSMAKVLGKKMNLGMIETSFDASVRNQRIMEKVQQDLRKVLNLNLSLLPLSWQAFHQRIHRDPSPLFRYGWMAPFQDPITHLKVFMTGNLNNFSGCTDPSYDTLVNEIETLPSGPLRQSKIFEAQSILLEKEAAVVPLYHYVLQTGVSERIKTFKVNSFGMIQFKDLRL